MIWDASDANPMHRRLPAEVVSRRAYVPKKAPGEEKALEDQVIVDIKAATSLKPEARLKWLAKACKMVSDGKSTATDLYDVIVNRKFTSGLAERVRRKLGGVIRENVEIFSDKQQRYLLSSESPLFLDRDREVDDAGLPDDDAAGDADPQASAALTRESSSRSILTQSAEAAGGVSPAATGTTTVGASGASAAATVAGTAGSATASSASAPGSSTAPARASSSAPSSLPFIQAEGKAAKTQPASLTRPTPAFPSKLAAREDRPASAGSGWQTVEDDAARRRHFAEDTRREAERRGRQRHIPADDAGDSAESRAAAEEAARKKKIEEEADDLFALIKTPAPAQQPAAYESSRIRDRDRDRRRRQAARSRSRSVSSREARKVKASERQSRRSWQDDIPTAALTGSRALLLNKDYQEDLPHLPRPTDLRGAGARVVQQARLANAFGSPSRSPDRSRGKRRKLLALTST